MDWFWDGKGRVSVPSVARGYFSSVLPSGTLNLPVCTVRCIPAYSDLFRNSLSFDHAYAFTRINKAKVLDRTDSSKGILCRQYLPPHHN